MLSSIDVGSREVEAWRSIGMNLDGLSCANETSHHCSAPGHPEVSTFDQGYGGIDNQFAARVLPLLGEIRGTDVTTNGMASILHGDWTHVVTLGDLPLNGDAQSLRVGWLPSFGRPGESDTTTAPWQPARFGAPATFLSAYLVDDTLVANEGEIDVALPWPSHELPTIVHLHHARLFATVSRAVGQIREGTLAGTFDPGELATALVQSLRTQDPTCYFEGAADLIQRIIALADVRAGGAAPSAGESRPSCDGISFAMSFEADLRALPPDVPGKLPSASCE